MSEVDFTVGDRRFRALVTAKGCGRVYVEFKCEFARIVQGGILTREVKLEGEWRSVERAMAAATRNLELPPRARPIMLSELESRIRLQLAG